MKHPHLKLSVMMFIEWFIWGAWFVPLWQYLNKLGFTPGKIACSYSSTAIAAILSPVLVGVIADRYFAAQKVLGWIASGLVVAVMLLLLLFFRERSDNITPIDVARS